MCVNFGNGSEQVEVFLCSAHEQARQNRRKTHRLGSQRVKLRSVVGVVERKGNLKCAMLNVDGLSPSTLEDIKEVFVKKQPDLCYILESKRREEDIGIDIAIDGYAFHEVRRSDVSGDKGGGGLVCYTRIVDGVVFQEYKPDIGDPDKHFVAKERMWMKTESSVLKTAICGAYFGCQTVDDKYGCWNEAMYDTLHEEVTLLKNQGFRVVVLADFNGHVGNKLGEGVVGNNGDVNPNVRRFLNFLRFSGMKHVNGLRHLTKGLWTRQRGSSKSILDFATVTEEHLPTVQSLVIDDKGVYGGGADHNWMFLSLLDNFMLTLSLLWSGSTAGRQTV